MSDLQTSPEGKDAPTNADTQRPDASPHQAVKLRQDPPIVMRLSRKTIGIGSAIGFGLIGSALIYALAPTGPKKPDELYNTDSRTAADAVASAPKNYGEVPKLGPPLPGDLGKPILDAQNKGTIAALPPVGSPQTAPENAARQRAEQEREAARQRLLQERDAAREARVFFGGAGGGASSAAPTGDAAPLPTPPAPAPPTTEAKPGFLDRAPDRRTMAPDRLMPAQSHVLHAGSIIPAALITGIRSDLPGLVTAQVTQNVYDSATGRILLIPQGARLIGDYESDVAFGQNRVLLAWTRLILPDGRSIILERQPVADAQGFAGLQDGTDFHWGGVLKAALVSTLLGIGSELGSGSDGDLARAVRRGTQDSVNRAGEQVVSRALGVKPTLTIRPGYPVRVMVTRDLMLGDVP